MAPRPYWKGYLKLSLVSCAVALYPAASKGERISFHWLNRDTGNRLRQLMVDAGTEDVVEREDRVRGFQVAKNDYLQIEDEDLDAVEIESSHTIDIETFIPRKEIDPVYLDSSYYLVPDDKVAEEAFAVIREAMGAEGVAGIGRAVISRRERLLVLEPRDKGILATFLHYNYEVRDDHAYFDAIPGIQIQGEMLDLAKHIIRTKLGHFDISKFEDRYENALIEMIRAKQAGRPVEAAKPQRPANVINLMDALRKSVAAGKQGPSANGARNGPLPEASASGAKGRATGKESAGSKRARHPAGAKAEPERTERSGSGGGGRPASKARPPKAAGRR
jgi:DNA end-binding protein Ku